MQLARSCSTAHLYAPAVTLTQNSQHRLGRARAPRARVTRYGTGGVCVCANAFGPYMTDGENLAEEAFWIEQGLTNRQAEHLVRRRSVQRAMGTSRHMVAERVAQYTALVPGVDLALAALCEPSFLEMDVSEGSSRLMHMLQRFPHELAPSVEPNMLSVQSLGVLSGNNSTSSEIEYAPLISLDGFLLKQTEEEEAARRSFKQVQFIAKYRQVQEDGQVWNASSCISTECFSGTNLDHMHVSVVLPEDLHQVHRIEISSVAHDQGLNVSIQEDEPSGTWAEVGVKLPGHKVILGRASAYANRARCSLWQDHEVTFDFNKDDVVDVYTGECFADHFRPGMQVGLVLRSLFPGWCHHVKRASITVWYSSVYDTKAEEELSQ